MIPKDSPTDRWKTSIVNAAAVSAAILILFTMMTTAQRAQETTPTPQASPSAPKPRFSLSTNRTYSPGENTRVYINYQNVNTLDFRVYRVKDPVRFFKQLNNPHQMGEEDQASVSEVAERRDGRPAILERVRSFKRSIYYSIKSYMRDQLRRESRVAFNDRFRSGERLPLYKSDYARVPLLNENQLVGSWRQVLSPLENEYDTRMVSLDRREPGVYLVEAVNGDLRAYTIAVVTELAMISKTTNDGSFLVYAVDRKSGEPRTDVKIEVVRKGKTLAEGTTDRDGVLKTRIEPDPKPKTDPVPPEDRDPEEDMGTQIEQDYLIMASRRNDFAVSDLSSYYFRWNNDYDNSPLGEVTHYIYTDRPVYRPDQTVHFKGVLRRMGEGGYEMLDARTVSVTVSDQAGAEIWKGDVALSPRGTFGGSVDIGAAAPLGSYGIVVKIGESEVARHYFEVAEYKKPEYKVTVATPKQFVNTGQKTSYTIEAKYFFGEPVSGADVKYYIYRSRYYHWWWSEGEDDGIGPSEDDEDSGDEYGYGNDMVKEGEGQLGSDGKLTVEFTVPPTDEKDQWDYSYRLEAQVTDSSRRSIDGKASFVGTRGSVVAFSRPERYVYYKNDTARIKIRTADYEGRPQAARVTLRFNEIRYEKVDKEENGYKYTEYKEVKRELSKAEVRTSLQGEGVYDYRVPIVGYIRIDAIVNENGKQIPSYGGSLYATDRNDSWADNAYRDYGSIKLVADRKSYKPGETARVLAMLPTDKAHLLVTTEMTSVVEARHVYSAGRAVMLEIPIRETYSPNVFLSVSYIRNGEMYEHSKSLAVPAKDKFLTLEIIPDKKQYKPRDPASYTVIARKADGTPASGVELSMGVVDEAIYSIRPDTSGDIRRAFYGTRYSRVSTSFSSAFSFTGYSGEKEMQLARTKRSFQLADFKNESQYVEPTIRKEFKDTAFWQSDLVTGADGKATLRFNLPDNLTTWRATARAVSADLSVGSKIDRVLSRKDLILRLETPRFMTEGDVVTVSGIVHNYLDDDKGAQIELKVSGASLLDQAQQTVTVLKRGEQRIDWRIFASQVGRVTLLATAKTNTESDGIELGLPIVPVGLKQTIGDSETLSGDSEEKTFTLNLPPAANLQARSLRIEAAPSVAASLFGALDYLTGYPYGCTEQTMSSFIPNVVVAQALKDVKSTTIRQTNDLPKKVQRGLDRLYEYQHSDGGWGWWKDDKTDPFMTAYVVDGMAMALRAGYGVENYRLTRGRDKLRQLIDTGKLEDGKPIDPESRAYLIYAYTVSGEADAKYLNDLFSKRNALQPYGRALLALGLKAKGDQDRARQVAVEIERSARTSEFDAHWESRLRAMLEYREDVSLEATALSIKALAQINPQSKLLPKAARWLVNNRRNGYFWETTKHTAFAIYGLTDYIKSSRELSADYTVEVWLNGEQVLSKRVTAAEAAGGQSFVIERKGTELAGSNQVRVVKRGSGVLYASAALEYFTRGDNIPAQSTQNLRMTRQYMRLRVTETNGKPKWAVEPLTGDLVSGDLIVVRLSLQGSKGRYLMIEDPIPAGCEQIERVSGINLNYTEGRWSDWYSNREFRDQRTVIFDNYFDGDATFQYALRVIVPGEFKVAPARAELMYEPTVQANTSNLKMSIIDRKR
ncbi:MAG: alpha-2-macroglobulin [Blastocatellales bacterium]